MGAHSRKGQRNKRHTNNNNNNSRNNEVSGSAPGLPPPPPCVAKLYASQYSVVEEGCVDVTAFALQPNLHATLLSHNVPQRLAEIFLIGPYLSTNEQGPSDLGEQPRVRRDVLYMQTAAVEALRNFIVNSSEDAVIDALTTTNMTLVGQVQENNNNNNNNNTNNNSAVNVSFHDGLAALVVDLWELVQKTHQQSNENHPSTLLEEVEIQHNETNDAEVQDEQCVQTENVHQRTTPFMAAARLLEEALHLSTVCVESSEAVAGAFSFPPVVHALLSITGYATRFVWAAIQHPDGYFLPYSTNAEDNGKHMLRHAARSETHLFAALAIAASEVLHILSGDNEALAALLQSAEAMAPHQTFLNETLNATSVLSAIRDEMGNDTHTYSSDPTDKVYDENPALLATQRQNLLHQLCEVSLRIQGTLVNASATPANATRVLPLVVSVLDAHPPLQEWRRVVPYLLQTCALPEELRVARIATAVWRLRCDQAALNVLHTVVDAVCGMNAGGVDDEIAFRQNPHSALLYSSNAMFVLGKLMKDALRLDTAGSDATLVPDLVVERALRAAAGDSSVGAGGQVTKLQFLVLSCEVAVWSLANTLLLMVPWSGLGEEPANIWRAIVQSLVVRRALLAEAEAAEAMRAEGTTTTTTTAAAAHVARGESSPQPQENIASTSPAAKQLFWLQVESLVQMLWTMQRKQCGEAGGPLQVTNRLGASATDVDALTRLVWESRASALLRQACVGAVCGTCASFREVDSTMVAARFALAVLQTVDESATRAFSVGAPPSGRTERRQWLAAFTAADAVWRVRCEAANQLMDLFLDESCDANVYVPLGVHVGLKAFLPLFHGYVKKRQQVARDMQRNYRVTIPEVNDAEHWGEVLENLEGFLDYKAQQLRC